MTDTPDPSLRGARTRAHARVSIIMPAFNAERFIREAIESVLAQTFGDYELIVVDDGSIDRTLAVVETYRSGTQVLRQPHAGSAAARNYGLRQKAGRPEFTRGLLFRMLPVGQRKDTEVLRHLEELAGRTEQLLRGIVAEASSRGSPRLDLPLLWATFQATLALLYFRKRLPSRTVVHLLLGLRAQPWGVVRPLLGRDARVKWGYTALKTMVAHFRTPRRRSLVG